MSSSICRAMGYALDDVIINDHKIVDPRINPNSPLLTWSDPEPVALDYFKYLSSKFALDADAILDEQAPMLDMFEARALERGEQIKERRSPRDAVIWASEYSLPNVLMIQPITMPDWTRRADPLDEVEEGHLIACDDSKRYRIEEQLFPFYPFDIYMDKRDGRHLKPYPMAQFRRATGPYKDSWNLRYSDAQLDALAQDLGFEDRFDATGNAVPLVPAEVRELALWGELFTDESVYLQLRPSIYTWWS